MNFDCLGLPSLWHFVIEALANLSVLDVALMVGKLNAHELCFVFSAVQ